METAAAVMTNVTVDCARRCTFVRMDAEMRDGDEDQPQRPITTELTAEETLFNPALCSGIAGTEVLLCVMEKTERRNQGLSYVQPAGCCLPSYSSVFPLWVMYRQHFKAARPHVVIMTPTPESAGVEEAGATAPSSVTKWQIGGGRSLVKNGGHKSLDHLVWPQPNCDWGQSCISEQRPVPHWRPLCVVQLVSCWEYSSGFGD